MIQKQDADYDENVTVTTVISLICQNDSLADISHEKQIWIKSKD